MKLLNALEDHAATADDAAARKPWACCCALYPAAPHITHALWTALGYERLLATWSTPLAGGGPGGAGAGRDRAHAAGQRQAARRRCVPADADRHAIEAAALATPSSPASAKASRRRR